MCTSYLLIHNLQLISLLRACSCWVCSKRVTHGIQPVGNHTAIWHYLLCTLLHMVHGFSSLCPCPEGSKYENQCLVQFFCLSLTPLVINKKQSNAALLNKPLSLASLQRYPVQPDARASAAAPGCSTTTLQRGLMAASTASPTDSSSTRQEPRLCQSWL